MIVLGGRENTNQKGTLISIRQLVPKLLARESLIVCLPLIPTLSASLILKVIAGL